MADIVRTDGVAVSLDKDQSTNPMYILQQRSFLMIRMISFYRC